MIQGGFSTKICFLIEGKSHSTYVRNLWTDTYKVKSDAYPYTSFILDNNVYRVLVTLCFIKSYAYQRKCLWKNTCILVYFQRQKC